MGKIVGQNATLTAFQALMQHNLKLKPAKNRLPVTPRCRGQCWTGRSPQNRAPPPLPGPGGPRAAGRWLASAARTAAGDPSWPSLAKTGGYWAYLKQGNNLVELVERVHFLLVSCFPLHKNVYRQSIIITFHQFMRELETFWNGGLKGAKTSISFSQTLWGIQDNSWQLDKRNSCEAYKRD